MKSVLHKKSLITLLLFVACLSVQETAHCQNTGNIRANRSTSTSSTTSTVSNNSLLYNDEEPDTTTKQEPQGIIFDSDEEADSVLRIKVFAFEPERRDVKIHKIANPLLDPTGAQFFNPAQKIDNHFYLDLGALGQCQKELFPSLNEPGAIDFVFMPDIHPVYRKNLHRNKLFQTQTPYTLLGYGSSLNKDYQIQIIHTQNIKPRWNVAFLYDLVSRDGLYTNSEVTNHIIDFTTNYYSADSRYQLQAGINNNRLRQQENGGVTNDTTCWSYPRESGVPVNMYAAQNQWRDFRIWIHQSYNTVRQFEHLRPQKETVVDTVKSDTIYARPEAFHGNDTALVTGYSYTTVTRDTIVGYDTIRPPHPHTYNTGVFGMDMSITRSRRIFYDSQADSWFYNQNPLDTTFFLDSTAHYRIASELYWTNDAYMSHRWKNPFVLYFGIRPEYNRIQYANDTTIRDYGISEFTVSPFARALFNIGAFRLKAEAEEVNGGRRTGDYRLSAEAELYHFRLSVKSEAVSPDLVFYHNEGYYAWNNSSDSFRKTKRQRISAEYNLHPYKGIDSKLMKLEVGASATLISDNVWFSSAMVPVQGDKSGLLVQSNILTHLRLGWFNIQMQEMVQHSSDEAVIRVPLFASKNSIYADVNVFRGALRLQTGFDLRYHTKYKADGWNPVLGAFYRQDDVEVGNYLVADYWINLQIKRASIYLKASHFNAPIEDLMKLEPNYFSLPHYPLENFGLYWGLTWKFFN